MWVNLSSNLLVALLLATAVLSQDIRTQIACEWDTVKLECNRGEYITIKRGFFGRTSVSICGLEGNTNCSSQGAEEIIKQRCDKLQGCSVKASTEVFGEPCVGTLKYLEVSYQCVPERKCKRNELVCHDGKCIGNRRVCDGITDCVGGEDEHECPK